MANHFSSEAYHEITGALNQYLADTTVVYYKSHTFHWNVQGANFYSLHLMFEKFYQQIWESMDEIAERTRALGGKTPEGLSELLKLATIKEAPSLPACHIMVKVLRADYLALANKAREVSAIAEKHNDPVTTDMMTEKRNFLEKAAWMLQSTLND